MFRQIKRALLLIILVRALVPLGYMPGNLLAGEWMSLCPVGSAASYELLQLQDHHHGHDHGQTTAASADKHCPLGNGLSAAVLPTTEPVLFIEWSAPDLVDVATTTHPQISRIFAARPRAPPAVAG